jgi:Ricin-type beta-trefoil lectin domain-like
VSGRRARPPARRAAPVSRIGVIVSVLVVCATAAAFVVRAAAGHGAQPKPLSTMMASQQPVGLAGAGPQQSSPQLLLGPGANGGLAFLTSGTNGGVQSSQQWQADRMTDGSYVLVYVPNGNCLATVTSAGGTVQPKLQSCDLQLDQRWSHPYLGKDPSGRDYWQLRSMAAGRCLAANGNWDNGTTTSLQSCSTAFPWQQLVAFWSAY